MNVVLHRAPAIGQAHIMVPLPHPERGEGRTIPPASTLLSREELRLIILDIMG